ncbi:MAG: hypothetical protein H6918_10760 [Sphingomonadaceae bacterium]|nr:hypothetical protein [Sphingomonadaceae bacterium]
MLKRIICSLSGHVINRHRVWNDGYDYRTSCDRCGTPMLRDVDGWRPFDEARDNDLPRKPHPSEQAETEDSQGGPPMPGTPLPSPYGN